MKALYIVIAACLLTAFCLTGTRLWAQTTQPGLIDSLNMVNVENYGAVGDGATLCDSAFAAAIAAAEVDHSPIEVPAGMYLLSQPLVLDGINLVGAGDSSILSFTRSLQTGAAAITLQNTANGNTAMVIRNVRVEGPGTWQLGVANAGCNGVQVIGNAYGYLEGVRVQGFDKGLILANTCGHVYVENSRLTDNYYGIYFRHNSSDYEISSSQLDGNNFASIGMAADAGPDDVSLFDVHLGFGPYGIYQEPAPASQGNSAFMVDWLMMHCRFEQIGNAAIETDATYDPAGGNASNSTNIEMDQVGFSWGLNYTVAARPHAYAVIFDYLGGIVRYIGGEAPFRAYPGSGQTAAWSIALQGTTLFDFEQPGAAAPLLSIGRGALPTFNGIAASPGAGRFYPGWERPYLYRPQL